MESYIKEIIIFLITSYVLYVFILCFLITTFVYLTYRFWKMLLPKEEHNIFVSNAPVIWHNYSKETTSSEDTIVYNDKWKLVKFIEEHMLLLTILLSSFIVLIAKLIGLF